MNTKILAAAVVASLASGAFAGSQVFSASGAGGTFADGSGSNVPGATFTSVATIVGAGANQILDVWVEFAGLRHTFVGDIVMTLTAPDGTTVMDILSRPGRGTGSTFGYGSDFAAANSYSFSDAGAQLFNGAPATTIPSGDYLPSTNPNPPATNLLPYVYTPSSFVGTFGGGMADGNWTLSVTDWAGGDTGGIDGNWTVFVEVVPEPATFVAIGIGLAGLALARRRK